MIFPLTLLPICIEKILCQLLEITNNFFKTHFPSYFLEYGRRDIFLLIL